MNDDFSQALEDEELLKRVRAIAAARLSVQSTDAIKTPRAAAEHLVSMLIGEMDEVLVFLWLTSGNHPISWLSIRGGANYVKVNPRRVMRSALAANATGAILAHNHPSGRAVFSESDITMTQKLALLLPEFDIRFIDHILIYGPDSTDWMSYRSDPSVPPLPPA